ncbi:hypothetical protein [Gordonia sp. (in: high G+C Gram-positive bacteria)]|uniref:hypothetical protein n=1 Tax=Gordonia sp. (in: high G+C Gram-positive bacteria) TaxID=84139 RepID=UPI00333FD696
MDKPSTLAELIDTAAQRHDGASGRRLADIAQRDGFTLSHGTINRLRRGDKGTVSRATIEALAHLSGVSIEDALRAAGPTGRTQDAITSEYIRVSADALRLVVEYADAKHISTAAARAELGELVRSYIPPSSDFGDADSPAEESRAPRAPRPQQKTPVHATDIDSGSDPEGQAADDARPNVWRSKAEPRGLTEWDIPSAGQSTGSSE